MNPRERILVIIIGIVGVLAAGRAVKMGYDSKIDSLKGKIRGLERKCETAEAENKLAEEGLKEWMEIGRQTLSMDVSESKELLRTELSRWASTSGLTKPITKLDSSTVTEGNKGVRTLGCKVTAEGALRPILLFLFNVHRQPYMARCRELTLDAVDPVKKRGHMKMVADFEVLILPPNKWVRKIVKADLTPGKRKERPERLARATFNEYEKSIKTDFFAPYKRAPTPTPKPSSGKNTGKRAKPTPTPVPLAPDRDMLLARILSSPRGQQVVLVKGSPGGGRGKNRNVANVGEDQRVRIGETLYGGTLIFVHPRGAVSEKKGNWSFHPIGLTLKECKPLTEKDFPAVFYELSKLKRRVKGISRKDE